ncbi:hypothetical protein [Nocardia brasiliensis]|uniref:Uncharacterized protein n=1 Tax=Nocardia brasiliensis (strain ATCC 700358 / HUJEG-1) TaxID=1133849 RepID=K0EZ90_NOCB7|nr:hypothetical protein [Nocardia brasiliensis]AFU02807.1 hypothetical protein O3I_024260 [Nocardia brasiliensis ATCC 700358]OCF84553.1 hypothetical protein AW168_40870 [Nocardia brasiliensis]
MTSTESQTFIDALTHIDWQLEAGRHAQAREEFERALTTLATAEDLQRLTTLADTFAKEPYVIARARLRSLWRKSDPELQSWLNTFVSQTDPGLYRPVEDKPRWITTVPITAVNWKVRRMVARDPNRISFRSPSVATEISAEIARAKPEHIAALKAKRRPLREPRVVTDYIRTRFLRDTQPALEPSAWDRNYVRQVAEQILVERDRAGLRTRDSFDPFSIACTRTGINVRDDDRPAFQANGNGLDYDGTTVPPLQGWICVYCFGERSCSDHFRTDTAGQRVSDDGLCEYCHDNGRPGIAALPAGFTLVEELTAYCQYLTDHYPAIAPTLLDSLRERSTGVVRGLVLAYLDHQHQVNEPSPVTTLTPVALRRARCRSCYATDRLVDTHDLCETCRGHYRIAA